MAASTKEQRRFFTTGFKLVAYVSVVGAIVAVGALPPLTFYWLWPGLLIRHPGCIWGVALGSVCLALCVGVVFLPALQLSGLLRRSILKHQPPEKELDALPFVGLAYSDVRSSSLLDTDSDVGFVRIGGDAIELIGETSTRTIPLAAIRKVRLTRSSWYASLGALRRIELSYDDGGVFRTAALASRRGCTVFAANKRTAKLADELTRAASGASD